MKKRDTTSINQLMIGLAVCCLSNAAFAEGWSFVPYAGASFMNNQRGTLVGADGIADGPIAVSLDEGFMAGLGLRYHYANSPWITEFAWEYRSNDSTSSPATGDALPDGNYATNTFFLNGRYVLSVQGSWQTWVGGGLSYVQEIDLDSESGSTERSFSSSGDVGFQAMAGVNYALSDTIYLTSELRYSSLTSIDLKEEGGSGKLNDIDYNPLTLGLGIGFSF